MSARVNVVIDLNEHRLRGTRKHGVAAFDFDGTLAIQHTMFPFLLKTHGYFRVALAMLTSTARARTRDELKVATVGKLFKGMSPRSFQ